jgi:MFS family permease
VSAATMATSTFPIIVASVLAAELLSEFETTRAQIGLLTTASGLVGALASPWMGRLTDTLGSVTATRLVLITGAATLAALALSPTYGFLLGAALATGISNGWGNPATNALIVDNVPLGSRGIVTGVKQSGVQIGIFLGGLLLPILTAWWNWRVAVLVFLAMPLGGFIGLLGVKGSHHDQIRVEWSSERLPASVWWIAGYGFISGLATQALIAWIPLFAEEDQLWSGPAAGSLIALVGFAGIASRIGWSRASERFIGHGRTLRILGLLTTVTALLLAFAAMGSLPSWVLVPAALFLGGGAVAWNAVGMLAVMEFSPKGMVGKGTGLVLFGFLLGLAVGPPLMGLSVDVWGTYVPGWLATAFLLALSAVVSFKVPSGSTIDR